MNTIRVKKLNAKAILPTYGSVGAAGADLYMTMEEAEKAVEAALLDAVR